MQAGTLASWAHAHKLIPSTKPSMLGSRDEEMSSFALGDHRDGELCISR